jgi:hypothetical protein
MVRRSPGEGREEKSSNRAQSSPDMKTKPTRGRDFDWYWQKPFCDPNSPDYFGRGHWWNDWSQELPRFAADYEYLRRHPIVGINLLSPKRKKSSPLLTFLCEQCKSSWPRLSPDDRNEFAALCRASLAVNLVAAASAKVGAIDFGSARQDARNSKAKRGRKFERRKQLLEAHGKTLLRAVQQLAKEEAMKGKLILAVPWDSEAGDVNEIATDVARIVTHWREKSFCESDERPETKPERNTDSSRLKILADFEWTEARRYVEDSGLRLRKDAVTSKRANQNERISYQRISVKVKSQFVT